jgi:hypothetical protein
MPMRKMLRCTLCDCDFDFQNRLREGGLDLCEFEQGQVAGSCEYCNEPLGFVKCGGNLDLLRN